jgi:hypothetical protein
MTGGAVLTLVISLVGMGLILVLVLAAVSRAARKSAAAARRQYPDARHIEAGALFFGQESRGAGQMRGNGTLIFASSEIIFEQWVVDRKFRIPYRDIESVDLPKSFLGKTQFVPLLRVSYTSDGGSRDSMAWRVRDPSALVRLIDEARAAA